MVICSGKDQYWQPLLCSKAEMKCQLATFWRDLQNFCSWRLIAELMNLAWPLSVPLFSCKISKDKLWKRLCCIYTAILLSWQKRSVLLTTRVVMLTIWLSYLHSSKHLTDIPGFVILTDNMLFYNFIVLEEVVKIANIFCNDQILFKSVKTNHVW